MTHTGPTAPRDPGDDGLASIVAHLRREGAPNDDAAERIMAAVRTRPRPRRTAWRPAALRHWFASPAGFVAAAAMLLMVAFGAGLAVGRGARTGAAVVSREGPVRTTRFVLTAPDVRGVAVVGDFNAWDRSATPMRRDPQTGDWTVDLPLSAGRYTYAFVVDGGRFIPDPAAPLAPADDFGQRNSVVLVAASYRPIPPR